MIEKTRLTLKKTVKSHCLNIEKAIKDIKIDLNFINR